jgi:hypothetical protein
LHAKIERSGGEKTEAPKRSRPLKPGARDSGGGFNPYDHAGKKKR